MSRLSLRAMTVGMALALLGASPARALPEMDLTDDGNSDAKADLDGGGESVDDGDNVQGARLLEPPWWLRGEWDVDLGDGLDLDEDGASVWMP